MMKYFLQTFGCKSNQYESQAIREICNAAGFAEAAGVAEAGVYIINTCGVTGRAAASCRNAIRKAHRANPNLLPIITGCGVDLDEKWPSLDGPQAILVPNAKKHAIPDLVRAALAAQALPAAEDDAFRLGISSFHGHTRAFIKIQDGCDNFCTYCAVPYARGAPRSRKRRDILDEAERLVEAGHGELVLTGINIGVYRDAAGDFADLLADLAETPGLVRLRLGSVEPPQVTRRLVEAMRSAPKICPHLHLPLQAGSDRVLFAMGRRYSAGRFLDTVALLGDGLEHPAVTTDVIVGFPGEDGNDFEASRDVCRRAGFSRLHVFLYSPRPGTPAAALRRTTPDRVVEERKTELIELGRELAETYAAGCVGLSELVIAEKGGGSPHGLSNRYVKVRLPGRVEPGAAVEVTIAAADGADLVGVVRDR